MPFRSQAILGIIAQELGGWSTIVWDHGVLWREKVKALGDQHQESLFSKMAMVGLFRYLGRIIIYKSTIVCPCEGHRRLRCMLTLQ